MGDVCHSLFSSHGAGLTPEGSGVAHCLRTGTAVSAGGTAFYALILFLEEIRLGYYI